MWRPMLSVFPSLLFASVLVCGRQSDDNDDDNDNDIAWWLLTPGSVWPVTRPGINIWQTCGARFLKSPSLWGSVGIELLSVTLHGPLTVFKCHKYKEIVLKTPSLLLFITLLVKLRHLEPSLGDWVWTLHCWAEGAGKWWEDWAGAEWVKSRVWWFSWPSPVSPLPPDTDNLVATTPGAGLDGSFLPHSHE